MRAPRGRHLTLISVGLVIATIVPAARSIERRAAYGDAFVDVDLSTGDWIIGNDSIRYTVGVSRQGTFRVTGLATSTSGPTLTAPRVSDTSVTIGEDVFALGAPDSAFSFAAMSASTGSHFVSLAVRFTARSHGLAATRYYVVYPDAGAVEMWTSIETLDDDARAVRNLNAFELTLPAGDVEYVSGLDTPRDEGGAFTRRRHALQDGVPLVIGSPTLSSETTLPFFTVDAGEYRVFGGLAWSGAWTALFARDTNAVVVSVGLPEMSAVARPGIAVEGPHAFIGAASGGNGSDVAAISRFTRQSRAGRAFPALTTFNTWFVHGINVDEAGIRHDMDFASTIGIELFQLDAGWYERDRPAHNFDFTDGLGTWAADPARFPSGLGHLADYAHALNMQFGVWVEPERVDLATVGRPGMASESFLATQQGAYRPGVANDEARDAQVCLAHPAARQWVQQRLFALIDDVRPDNLKWDFNRWVHCTRADHGHPVDGGNYEHTRALYELLSAVRGRYPHLTIENCAGGGHRLDFAMARLTDAAWMDDTSAPSRHVRRNLNGLFALFPAPYLLSYVMPHDEEPLRGAEDLLLLVRSRMPGVVGLAAALGQLSEAELNVLHQEYALARRLRGAQHQAVTYALTPQRPGVGEWEVVQQLVPESGISYLFAYSERVAGPVRVWLHGLDPERTYELRSADRGVIGRVVGADLIVSGLEIHEAPESAAQVLVLEPVN